MSAAVLFACSKCFSRHPFEELSSGQQLCKVCFKATFDIKRRQNLIVFDYIFDTRPMTNNYVKSHRQCQTINKQKN